MLYRLPDTIKTKLTESHLKPLRVRHEDSRALQSSLTSEQEGSDHIFHVIIPKGLEQEMAQEI